MLAQLEPHWFVLSETNSTNTLARELLTNALHTPPFVVFAKHQTAGAGQRGKMWLSQANASITASLAVPLGQISLSLAPIVAGLGVLEGVAYAISDATLGAPPIEPITKSLYDGHAKRLCLQLKWPNDVLLNGSKLGGILCERVGANLVIGVGLNVWPNAYDDIYKKSFNMPFNTAPSIPPTALLEHSQTLSKSNKTTPLLIAEMVFSRLWAYWQIHSAAQESLNSTSNEITSHDTICASFAKVDALMNKPLDLWQNGKLVGHGLGKGLHTDGRYRIQMGEINTLWHSGELSIRLQNHVV